jgi:hypothetical protein
MRSPCCLCVCPTSPSQMPKPVFMKFGTHIMASETISTAHFINLSRQSLHQPLPLLGNGSVKTLPRQELLDVSFTVPFLSHQTKVDA